MVLLYGLMLRPGPRPTTPRTHRELEVSSFSGKTVLVTGAARGIGKAVSVLLAERGAQLVLVDINEPELTEVAEEVGLLTGTVAVAADVADPEAVDGVFNIAQTRFGHLDGLASNAGIIGAVGPLTSTTVAEYQRLMLVNAQSAFLYVRAFAAAAQASGHPGSIVLTSSAAGIKGTAGLVAYSMTKQALVGLARSAAVELGPKRIRVNAVCPGRIDTPLLDALNPLGGRASGLQGRPIDRMADPREVAYLISWLLSDEAAFAIGVLYPIDVRLTP